MLHLAFMESGRILCGFLNEEKDHLDDAAQVILRQVVPKKDKNRPDYVPDKKEKDIPIIEVAVVGISHPLFCFNEGCRIPHYISTKNSLTVLSIDKFSSDVREPILAGYNDFLNPPAKKIPASAKKEPEKEKSNLIGIH